MSKEKFDYFIKGEKGKYEVVIGLEVHAQVQSKSKLFSGSSTKFGADPNNQVSLIDSAFPGMLPVINEECVKQAVRTGLGLNAKINNYSVFDRKNYFYADLPQGYQISQYKNPIVGEGKVLLDMPYGSKEIGIERLHLEQDAGKSIHDMDPSNTYVDLNRSGIALMEIVSKPDLRSPEEVNAYVKKLSFQVKAQCNRIDAVTLAGRSRTIIKHMSEMGFTISAHYFYSNHPVTFIFSQLNCIAIKGAKKTRPS